MESNLQTRNVITEEVLAALAVRLIQDTTASITYTPSLCAYLSAEMESELLLKNVTTRIRQDALTVSQCQDSSA